MSTTGAENNWSILFYMSFNAPDEWVDLMVNIVNTLQYIKQFVFKYFIYNEKTFTVRDIIYPIIEWSWRTVTINRICSDVNSFLQNKIAQYISNRSRFNAISYFLITVKYRWFQCRLTWNVCAQCCMSYGGLDNYLSSAGDSWSSFAATYPLKICINLFEQCQLLLQERIYNILTSCKCNGLFKTKTECSQKTECS